MNTIAGLTPSERYLARLARRSFLSLWSHANVFHKAGKELADLLVVCGQDILIFQDKQSAFPESGDLSNDWGRWFRKTIEEGARQVWGAERVLKMDPHRVLFEDAAAQKQLEIKVPSSEARYHLIVVTHDGSRKCKEVMGGSGSFMLTNDIRGLASHKQPFLIGDLDPGRTFVHVLDDTTLEILMRTLDTISDFTAYLRKKEQLLRSPIMILATGDEELLANYLKHINDHNEHDFDFGHKSRPDLTGVAVAEGGWEHFVQSPERIAQIEQDKISYMWDELIETFSHHAIHGTQVTLPGMHRPAGVSGVEKVMRIMAQETRFMRRILSSQIKDMFLTTPETQRRIKVMRSMRKRDLYYVLLLFPLPESKSVTYEQYRIVRANFLEGTCLVAKLQFPDAKEFVGIATETGIDNRGRSEDAMYLDATQWTSDMEIAAREFQGEFGVLVNPRTVKSSDSEYPKVASKKEFLRNPRNKPCPCGSGKKYKKCCYLIGREFYK